MIPRSFENSIEYGQQIWIDVFDECRRRIQHKAAVRHLLLDNISLLSAAISKPATCKGLGSVDDLMIEEELYIPRENTETFSPVGPRWRNTYIKLWSALLRLDWLLGPLSYHVLGVEI